MQLSKDSVIALSDLIANKLAIMTIDDRDDLREMVALKRALSELHGNGSENEFQSFGSIPRRGRRKKITEMMVESQSA